MLVFAESFSNCNSISMLVAMSFQLISVLQNVQDFTVLIVTFGPLSSISFSVLLLESFNSRFLFFSHVCLKTDWDGRNPTSKSKRKQTNKEQTEVVRARKKCIQEKKRKLLYHQCARAQHFYNLQTCFLFFSQNSTSVKSSQVSCFPYRLCKKPCKITAAGRSRNETLIKKRKVYSLKQRAFQN